MSNLFNCNQVSMIKWNQKTFIGNYLDVGILIERRFISIINWKSNYKFNKNCNKQCVIQRIKRILDFKNILIYLLNFAILLYFKRHLSNW